MTSVPSRDGEFQFDAELETPRGRFLLEVRRTSGTVDLRGVLLSLAYALEREPSSRAICVLMDTRVANERLDEEINRFKAAVHHDLSSRVFLVAIRNGVAHGELPPGDSTLLPAVIEAAEREVTGGSLRVSQQAVKSAALTRWLTTRGLLGVAEMERATDASRPTVIAAFRAMQQDGLVYPSASRWHLAEELPWDNVRRMVEAHAAERRVIRFKDPTGHARTPLHMAERLRKLQSGNERLDVDLGGVLGAQQYYPDLDITGAPRLDLCVYGGDTGFVRKIDAGLIETTNLMDKAVLVIHMTRDPRSGPRPPGELRPASVIDCLADLFEIGLLAEAHEFWIAMTRRRQAIVQQSETQG